MLIWFSGLIRGAIAFALSLEINSSIAPHRVQMVSTTLMMVLMTTVVLGGVMSAFCKLIGLDAEGTAEPEDNLSVRDSRASRLSDIIFKTKKKSWIQLKFHLLDDKVLKPCFGGDMSKLKKHKEERKLEEERRTQFQKIQAIKHQNRQTENVASHYNGNKIEDTNGDDKPGRSTQLNKTENYMKGTSLDMIAEDEEDEN